jgi:hypothetical protein
MHDQHERHAADERHRLEILQRIVRRRFDERTIDSDFRRSGERQRVTVGLGARDDAGADHPARAGAVVDDDALREHAAKFLADQACGDVGTASGRIADDETHRPGGITVRRRSWDRQRGECSNSANPPPPEPSP